MKKQLRFLQSGMGCTERIQATYSALSGASKKIADFVIDHPDQAVHMTVVQLAESCEVSEASVVRFCQCLQYAGFYEFKLSLAAEIVPASQMIQEDITGANHSGKGFCGRTAGAPGNASNAQPAGLYFSGQSYRVFQ